MKRTGEARWTWRIGRGRSMARKQSRREVAPFTRLENSLDDASRYTARYDALTDWSDGRSTITEKLMVSSWVLRYWRAGPQFRGRMVRSLIILLAAAAASIGLVLLAS